MYTIFCFLMYFLAKDVVTKTDLKSVVSNQGEIEIAAYDLNRKCLFSVKAINSQGRHLLESKNEKIEGRRSTLNKSVTQLLVAQQNVVGSHQVKEESNSDEDNCYSESSMLTPSNMSQLSKNFVSDF